jgi:hypothetical protein
VSGGSRRPLLVAALALGLVAAAVAAAIVLPRLGAVGLGVGVMVLLHVVGYLGLGLLLLLLGPAQAARLRSWIDRRRGWPRASAAAVPPRR